FDIGDSSVLIRSITFCRLIDVSFLRKWIMRYLGQMKLVINVFDSVRAPPIGNPCPGSIRVPLPLHLPLDSDLVTVPPHRPTPPEALIENPVNVPISGDRPP